VTVGFTFDFREGGSRDRSKGLKFKILPAEDFLFNRIKSSILDCLLSLPID